MHAPTKWRTGTAVSAAVLVLACAGCSPGGPASQTAPTPSLVPSPSWTASLSGGDHAQAPGATPLSASWDKGAEQAAKDAAAKAMALFARPGVDQRTWITDLAPLLSPAYRTEAEYIDPAKVPVRKVLAGPALETSAGEPLTARAVFATDAGEWVVLLHRTGAGQPWLVEAIASEND
ncbi:hypothetical protein [Sinomonas humi]|uniref:Lipoprotein n=1 Tax=Sinomonas humi TaxID=1338436 RepID=A0A0B2ALD4_9MICC|nr:hypothetical protein [Sinomonas humi]KHL02721.1 hypothetical protein LK10_11645 [Sinomonas humi]